MEKSITYFEKEGENYTDELISLVKQRLDESDEIRYILIASASCASALKLADAIEGDAQIINVSHHAGFSGPNEVDISDEMIDKLEEKGVDTFIGSHALSGVGRGITNKLGGINEKVIPFLFCATDGESKLKKISKKDCVFEIFDFSVFLFF